MPPRASDRQALRQRREGSFGGRTALKRPGQFSSPYSSANFLQPGAAASGGFGQPTGRLSPEQLRAMMGGSSSSFGIGPDIGGGGGGFRAQKVNLDKYRRAEISSSRRLIDLQFRGVRQELEGTVAQTELDRDYNLAQLSRGLRQDTQEVRGSAMSRGILDSGIFLENLAEVEGAAAETEGYERNKAAAMIGGLRSQMALLGAQRSAQIANERAQIERAYLMARLSYGY